MNYYICFMQPTANCLNCESVLTGQERFCSQCGQKAETHRFSWHQLFHEAWHAITHTDKGLLSLVKGLIKNPGLTCAEYVGGKHKKYFNPITFAIFSLALMVLANTYFKPFGDPKTQVNQAQVAQFNEEQKKLYLAFMGRLELAANVSQKHPNVIAMISFPLQALFFWMFFRKRGRNYVEVLVATIFVGSFGTLLFSVVLSPITSIFPNQLWKSVMGAAGLLLSAAYVAWGMQGFLADPKPPAYWKTFLVSLLYYMVLFTLSTAIIFWYVFQERTPMLLKAFINEVFK